MARAFKPGSGSSIRVPPGNSDRCPGCGSFCSRTEANKARRMISGEDLADALEAVSAKDLRIKALEAELNVERKAVAKLTKAAGKPVP